jgi:hypothetical protein
MTTKRQSKGKGKGEDKDNSRSLRDDNKKATATADPYGMTTKRATATKDNGRGTSRTTAEAG